MAWPEFRKTLTGTGKRFNEKTGLWEKGSWYAVGRAPDGTRISEPAMAKTGTGFKAARDKVEAIENGEVSNAESSATLQSAYEEFKIHVNSTLSPNTWRCYSWGLVKLLDFFGKDCDVADVTAPKILRFRAEMMKAHNINGTIDILKYVRTFFMYCKKLGYIPENPASGSLRGLKIKKVAHFLTTEEIRHVLSNCLIDDLRDIVKVALLTGMREDEISNMRTSWVRDNTLYVLGKGSKNRQIPIFSKVRPILEAHLTAGDNLIFPGWNVGRIRQAWKRTIHRAKKTVAMGRTRFHDLRHTFASNYLQDGGRLEDLQEIMGHSSISITNDVYKHLSPSHLSSQMEKMKASFMDEAPPQLKIA